MLKQIEIIMINIKMDTVPRNHRSVSIFLVKNNAIFNENLI